MVTYTITRWLYATAMEACEFTTCKRAPAAKQSLRNAVYNMLRADALLDRPIAAQLMQQVEDCEVSPPKRGYFRHERFTLDNGAFVTFEAWL